MTNDGYAVERVNRDGFAVERATRGRIGSV
jgi:hypothetical protein